MSLELSTNPDRGSRQRRRVDMAAKVELIPIERIESRILLIRGLRVLIDADLAELYGVPTRALNQAVRRNEERFPEDFMFQVTAAEAAALRSQFVISKKGRGGRRYLPNAFTEHGAIMAANVLNSTQAMKASVLVVRAFVRLRRLLAANHELAGKLAELEQRIGTHDRAIQGIMKAIRDLMEAPPDPPKERIGFRTYLKEHPRARVMR